MYYWNAASWEFIHWKMNGDFYFCRCDVRNDWSFRSKLLRNVPVTLRSFVSVNAQPQILFFLVLQIFVQLLPAFRGPSGLAPFPGSVVSGEPPPPYSPQGSPDSGTAAFISCRVCQSSISVEGKAHQHVVKCNICSEATVSRTATAASGGAD